jgi:hypothetical protein
VSLPTRYRYPNLPADLVGYHVKVRSMNGSGRAWWHVVLGQRGPFILVGPTNQRSRRRRAWYHQRSVIDSFKP